MSRSAVKPAIRSSRAARTSQDGPLRHRFLNGLQVLGAGMEKQVDVGVDQARQQGAVAEVDGLGASGMAHGCAHLGDSFAFDQDLAGREDFPGFDLEQAGRV